jgi:hypothetical protein
MPFWSGDFKKKRFPKGEEFPDSKKSCFFPFFEEKCPKIVIF